MTSSTSIRHASLIEVVLAVLFALTAVSVLFFSQIQHVFTGPSGPGQDGGYGYGYSYMRLLYSAGINGSLSGDTNQVVFKFSNGEPVTAVPNSGYEFWKWDDDVTDNPRIDEEPQDNITVTALFVTTTVSRGSGGGSIHLNRYVKTDSPYASLRSGERRSVGSIDRRGITLFVRLNSEALFSVRESRSQKEVEHMLRVSAFDLEKNVITLTIMSEPVVVQMPVETARFVDVDGDSVHDMRIEFVDVDVNTAELLVSSVSGDIDSDDVVQEEEVVQPVAQCPAVFERNLALQSVGEDVRSLQKYLNANGFIVASTGPGSMGNETSIYGPLTKATVARFQSARGITGDEAGVFGEQTRRYLGCLGASVTSTNTSGSVQITKNLRIGMVDEEVRLLQKYLNTNGFVIAESGPGSLGNETAIFGPKTMAAVIRFQRVNSISPAIGFVGPITRAAMQTQ